MSYKEKILIIGLFIFSLLIRVIGLKSFPPGFYTDESAVGYSAYSILKTGRDEFGKLYPLAFKSFNDFKAPIYIYSVVPSIAIFGLNEFSVRLPSAIFSCLTVLVVYFLTKELTKDGKTKIKKYLPFLVSIIFSLSPWHFTFSRIAFEGNTSLFFTVLGIWLFLEGSNNKYWYPLSLISFSLSIYSYHSARIVSPLLVVGLLIFQRKQIFKNLKFFLVSCLIAFLFSLPLIKVTLENFDDIVRRPANVSIFKDKGVEGKIWKSQVIDSKQPIILTRILHNKPYYYFMSFLKNYFSHFEIGYLFLYGDLGEHFRVPDSGGLFIVLLPFLAYGFYFLIKSEEKSKKIIFLWLFLSPIAAALTFMVPSGHRNLNAIIPLAFIISYGILIFVRNKTRVIILILLFLLNTIYFSYQYFEAAKLSMAKDWNYGYSEAVKYVSKIENNYDKIIFTDDTGETYMHYLFFKPYPPKQFQGKYDFTSIDKFGIGHINKIDNYEFRPIEWQKELKEPRILWIGTPKEIPLNDSQLNYLKIIYYPNHQPALIIVDLIY